MALLSRLRDAAGAFVDLADLGADAAAVGRDLDVLQAFGFLLERHPDRGVAYRGPARRLCPDQIEHDLSPRRIGRRVAVWSRVGSTNDLAARAASSRANDGLVILAEEQTAGRGRRGRSWSAAPGTSVLLSALIFPPGPLDDPGWLTALGALATAEVVESWGGTPAAIKWPNDVRVGERKVAGILVERGAGAVLGIGLNVNLPPADFPEEVRASATSLQVLRGSPLDRSAIARDLIRRLDAHFARGLDDGPEALAPAWRSRLEHLGASVLLETTCGIVAGRLVEADYVRGLVVESDDGRTRRFRGAEVLGLRPSSSSSAVGRGGSRSPGILLAQGDRDC